LIAAGLSKFLTVVNSHVVVRGDSVQNTRAVLDAVVELVVADCVKVARISGSLEGVVAVVDIQSVASSAQSELVSRAGHVTSAVGDIDTSWAKVRTTVALYTIFDSKHSIFRAEGSTHGGSHTGAVCE